MHFVDTLKEMIKNPPSAIHQCLGKPPSQDSDEERDLSVSFSESKPESSSASPIEMIEDTQESLDPSELLKTHVEKLWT